jgi:hypothetical protein
MRNFLLWLAARVLFVLAVTCTLIIGVTVGGAKYNGVMATQVLAVAGLSILCYGGFIAVWLTQNRLKEMQDA